MREPSPKSLVVPDATAEDLWNLDTKTLPERLKSVRAMRQMSQDEVAKRMNVTRASVSQWETASTRPDLSRLENLARIYRVPVEWLVTGDMKFLVDENTPWGTLYDGLLEKEVAELRTSLLLKPEQVIDWFETPREMKKKRDRDFSLSPRIETVRGIDPTYGGYLDALDCCAVEVTDNSMEPVLIAGDIVTIWDAKKAHIYPGDLVFVALKMGDPPVFRKLRISETHNDGTHALVNLAPLNPDWSATKELNFDSIHIVGVPVEVRRLLRPSQPPIG